MTLREVASDASGPRVKWLGKDRWPTWTVGTSDALIVQLLYSK
jgi:hypothetical protein